MADLTTDRKDWHHAEATMGRCEVCQGPLEEKMFVIPATDSVDYYEVCKNPDCPKNNN